jgi:hypothetical protein
MRWMRGAILSVVIFGLVSIPAEASPRVLAPPGHAGAQQYFETIPTSAGNAAPPGSISGSGNATAGPSALARLGHGRRGDTQLALLGKDGQAAAGLAASTAPSRVPTGSAPPPTSGGPGGSIASGISHALTGSGTGGLGIALPLLLATALVAALGILAARLWRGAPSRPNG